VPLRCSEPPRGIVPSGRDMVHSVISSGGAAASTSPSNQVSFRMASLFLLIRSFRSVRDRSGAWEGAWGGVGNQTGPKTGTLSLLSKCVPCGSRWSEVRGGNVSGNDDLTLRLSAEAARHRETPPDTDGDRPCSRESSLPYSP
jgi:hypothetical protein